MLDSMLADPEQQFADIVFACRRLCSCAESVPMRFWQPGLVSSPSVCTWPSMPGMLHPVIGSVMMARTQCRSCIPCLGSLFSIITMQLSSRRAAAAGKSGHAGSGERLKGCMWYKHMQPLSWLADMQEAHGSLQEQRAPGGGYPARPCRSGCAQGTLCRLAPLGSTQEQAARSGEPSALLTSMLQSVVQSVAART